MYAPIPGLSVRFCVEPLVIYGSIPRFAEHQNDTLMHRVFNKSLSSKLNLPKKIGTGKNDDYRMTGL